MDNFRIFFDNIKINKKQNEVIITGWAFDRKTMAAVSLNVIKTDNVIASENEVVLRNDVISLYHLSPGTRCGFVLKITVNHLKGGIALSFSSENGQTQKKIHLGFAAFREVLRKIKKYLSKGKKGRYYEYLRNKQYAQWICENEIEDLNAIHSVMDLFEYKPLISIIMPVYNVASVWLEKCIRSVQNQIYTNWELCIADDCSTHPEIRLFLEQMSSSDKRIKVVFRNENGHISAASNSALSIASGEFIALLDNDDELSPNALFEVVKCLNAHPDADLIYSDEDKIDQKGQRSDAFFKSDWAPETLMSTNYICHLGVYRKELIDTIGGFRIGYEGAQDYDLVLRFTEQTDKIYHIPKILYHWRISESSTAGGHHAKSYASDAGQRALNDALKRRGLKGKVQNGISPGLYDVEYDVSKKDLVSVIIPTKDAYSLVKRCVDALYALTDYPNYEVILVDNGSTDSKALSLFERYEKEYASFHVLTVDIPFNFSKLNNLAAKKAQGKYLLFLNNDTEIMSPDWMTRMVAYAQLDNIGAVGTKLLFPDSRIQHSGIILGLGGIAGHGHYQWSNAENGYFGKLLINSNYSAVTAACMMVKKSDFETVNGFSEALGVAYNDVDLCLRLCEKNKRTVCLHTPVIYHYESASRGMENTKEKRQRFEKESQLMLQKWAERIEHDPFYNPNLTKGHFDFQLNIKQSD